MGEKEYLYSMRIIRRGSVMKPLDKSLYQIELKLKEVSREIELVEKKKPLNHNLIIDLLKMNNELVLERNKIIQEKK